MLDLKLSWPSPDDTQLKVTKSLHVVIMVRVTAVKS